MSYAANPASCPAASVENTTPAEGREEEVVDRGKGGGDVGLWGGHGEGGDCVVVSDEACVSMMHTSVRYGGLAHSGVRLRDSSRALFQHVTVYSTLLAY